MSNVHRSVYDSTTEPMPSAQCSECEEVWFLNTLSGGHRPRRWWQCPNGCSDD